MSNTVAYTPDGPRYIWRELRGGRINADGGVGHWSSTFTILDTWQGFEVVLQRESKHHRTPVRLRERFALYCDLLNNPRLCQNDNCDSEIDFNSLLAAPFKQFCSHRCNKAQRARERRAALKA